MSRLRRYEGVDSAAQTPCATETVTMSLAATKVDCTQTWHVTRWTPAELTERFTRFLVFLTQHNKPPRNAHELRQQGPPDSVDTSSA